ncbi:MAG TPA: sigma-54 dependent transcriptional regulator [Candidatus Angelobacter sp.]|jgi:DNA-binding NtrC family response regulator|nr:sigma-54 dependent transcriptional regulator [Candidatus Angelobacter sp.]
MDYSTNVLPTTLEKPALHKAKVLIVDDDPTVLDMLNEFLVTEGYNVVEAADLKSARQILENGHPDIAVTDFDLPDGNALDFLNFAKSMNISMKTMVLTGHGSIELAVSAIKEGAEQFLTKPVDFALLRTYLRACIEQQQNKRKQLARTRNDVRHERNPFLGASSLIKQLSQEVHKIIQTERPILLQGETGTGKGVLAQWIHQNGPRSEESLVDVNCAGLSKELLESELFGYEKGAFTGAANTKQGLVEVAHRGILFLDEIGEMDITVQPKLLKVLEDNRFRRLGDVRERTTDIQVIAATNRDLMQSAKENKFREDLYYRISTFRVQLPPLRERVEDIPFLANSILRALASDLAREQKELSKAAEAELKAYYWPGNIRELRNVLERVALVCESRVIEPRDLALSHDITVAPSAGAIPEMTLDELERWRIAQVLEEEKGKVPQAALRLGVPRSTLYQKIKVLGIAIE